MSATDAFTPTVGMAITAHIDGNLCGQSTIEERNNQLVYKLQVMAENVSGEANGCGANGKLIAFKVGDWDAGQQTKPITDALAPLEGNYTMVYGYQASDTSDPWKKHDTAAPPFANDLSEMQPGSGYWIRMTQDSDWAFD